QDFSLNGQIFSDDQFFELNRFRISTAQFTSSFNFEAFPVDIFSADLKDNLRDANYKFDIQEFFANSEAVRNLIPQFPDLSDNIFLETEVVGTLDTLFVDKLLIVTGESSVQMSGILQHLVSDEFRYFAQFENVVLSKDELDLIGKAVNHEIESELLDKSIIRGSLVGTQTTLRPDLKLITNYGSLDIVSSFDFGESKKYKFELKSDSLNLAPVFSGLFSETNLNINLKTEGTGYDLPNSEFTADLHIDNSIVDHISIMNGDMRFSYRNGELTHNIFLKDGDAELNLSGSYSQQDGIHHVVLDSDVRNLNVQDLVINTRIPLSSLSMEFSTNFRASNLDDLYGRVSFDVSQAIIDEDTLKPHQFFADISPPNSSTRTLRLTSSFFDGRIDGNIKPYLIDKMARHWRGYIDKRIHEEILFSEDANTSHVDVQFLSDDISQLDLTINGEIKNLELLRKYFPKLPEIRSLAHFTTNINSTNERILITANISDKSFQLNNMRADSLNVNFTSSLRYSEILKEYSTIDLQINASGLNIDGYEAENSFFNISMRDDSLMVRQSVKNIAGQLDLDTTYLISLLPDLVEITLENFSMGSETYKWITDVKPKIRFLEKGAIELENLKFRSGTETFEVNGIYSEDLQDSLTYKVQNLNLGRISELIGGRISFSGNANGEIETRSLRTTPAIQGNFDINQIMIDNRTIGDLRMRSRLNPEKNQFDTNISIITNPEKYSRY
ncbi:MAG: hypothetical protein ACFCU6_11525, partial [Balneolaceae bacterium]